MPVMERAGSRDARTLTYQCGTCHHKLNVRLARPGDRTYNDRIPCPRCAYVPKVQAPETED